MIQSMNDSEVEQRRYPEHFSEEHRPEVGGWLELLSQERTDNY